MKKSLDVLVGTAGLFRMLLIVSMAASCAEGPSIGEGVFASAKNPPSLPLMPTGPQWHVCPEFGLDSVTPNTGPNDKEQQLTVLGHGFLASARLLVNGIPLINKQVISDTEIIATISALPGVIGEVRIVLENGVACNLSSAYSYSATDKLQFSYTHYSTGLTPSSLTVADIDKDGVVDFLFSHRQNSVATVLFGDGSGVIKRSKNFRTNSDGAQTIITADLEGNGIRDALLLSYSDNTMERLHGDTSGDFSQAEVYPTGALPSSIAAADFDADGFLDIIVANSGGREVTIFYGNSSGTVREQRTFLTGVGPAFVGAVDFNRDNYVDFITANADGKSISILINDKLGGFLPQREIPTGISSSMVQIDDFNKDGYLDLIVASRTDDETITMFGDGEGEITSTERFRLVSYPQSMTSGDIDGDRVADLMIAFPSAVAVFKNNGNGHFGESVEIPTDQPLQSLNAIRVDSDGAVDLVGLESDGFARGLVVMLNQSR